jgi:hypothetical protein
MVVLVGFGRFDEFTIFLNYGFPAFFIVISLGLIIYHVHRAVFHHIPSFIIMSIVRRSFREPKIRDLNFARWIRRNAVRDNDECKEAQVIQKALDIANAGTHFLYCSGLSAIVWYFFYKSTIKDSDSSEYSWLITILLFAAAIAGEFWTALHDLKAYKDYSIPDTEDAEKKS